MIAAVVKVGEFFFQAMRDELGTGRVPPELAQLYRVDYPKRLRAALAAEPDARGMRLLAIFDEITRQMNEEARVIGARIIADALASDAKTNG
jgi:hypothetical protein